LTLFHVEHAVRTRLEGDGAFGPRDQDLGANGSQALDDRSLVCQIEFRGKVVQTDDRPFAAAFGMKLGLGQQAGECRQLFLTS
jgi:hypothetical protein